MSCNIFECIKAFDHRPDWDEYFMTIACLISKRSSCERLHVGCVITKDRRIITTGYNGHVKGTPHTSIVKNGHEQLTIHAETNAIADAASRGVCLEGGTAYVTHYPCINCAKNLIASGIKHIIYYDDYYNDEICNHLYECANIKITKFDPFGLLNQTENQDENVEVQNIVAKVNGIHF